MIISAKVLDRICTQTKAFSTLLSVKSQHYCSIKMFRLNAFDVSDYNFEMCKIYNPKISQILHSSFVRTYTDAVTIERFNVTD